MSKLRDALKQYIELRRNLGSKLRGVDSALRNFVAFAERENTSYITVTWHSAGPRNRSTCSQQPGLRVFRWCDVSPSG